MLSANPILVMLLVPVMTLLIYPALGRFATPLRRMSYGMFLSGFSFVLVAWMQRELDAGVEMSVLWQTVPYVIITIAEVFFSTTGLEFAFREAAPEMKSTIMGFWQLTVAFGNLLVSVVTAVAGRLVGSSEGHVSVTPVMFLFYAGLTFVVAILFSLVTMRYRYQDKAAAEGR
jgi:POT family proton-dependent oligopeptide transporter